jgi:hypothetical protein
MSRLHDFNTKYIAEEAFEMLQNPGENYPKVKYFHNIIARLWNLRSLILKDLPRSGFRYFFNPKSVPNYGLRTFFLMPRLL